jgi:hypothetical protein
MWPMKKYAFFFVLVAGCHSSCDESTGAAPVVPDAAAEPVLGAAHTVQSHRSMSMRPQIMQQQNTATPAAPASTTP